MPEPTWMRVDVRLHRGRTFAEAPFRETDMHIREWRERFSDPANGWTIVLDEGRIFMMVDEPARTAIVCVKEIAA